MDSISSVGPLVNIFGKVEILIGVCSSLRRSTRCLYLVLEAYNNENRLKVHITELFRSEKISQLT